MIKEFEKKLIKYNYLLVVQLTKMLHLLTTIGKEALRKRKHTQSLFRLHNV